jgi:hypothetical protein
MRRRRLAAAVMLATMLGAPAEAATMAIMPVKMLDTSGEVRDQSAEHDARLNTMAENLKRDLTGTFNAVILVPEADLVAECPEEAPQCLLDVAGRTGADQALFAVVLKTSTLIMQLFVNIVDVADGSVLDHRELNFRNDTDESWQRAEQFLVQNLAGD